MAHTCPKACISFPPIRSPARKFRTRRGFAELFVNRWCILTPPENADKAAVEKLAAFWRALAPMSKPSAEHMTWCTVTSHLPHLIAYTITGTADELSATARSAEILRRRFSRFHPHRRVRSDHVARRLSCQ
jgi:cyclohexadieny/prephenate dehydrogenase